MNPDSSPHSLDSDSISDLLDSDRLLARGLRTQTWAWWTPSRTPIQTLQTQTWYWTHKSGLTLKPNPFEKEKKKGIWLKKCRINSKWKEKLRLSFDATISACNPASINKHVSYNQGPDGVINFAEIKGDGWDKYLESMAKDREWADAIIVTAMANMLQTDIAIVTSTPQSMVKESDKLIWIGGTHNFTGNPILLGHEWENHYRSLGKFGA